MLLPALEVDLVEGIPSDEPLALPTDAEGVKATMRGIRRTYGSARVRKAPAVAGKVLGMVATAPDNLSGLRYGAGFNRMDSCSGSQNKAGLHRCDVICGPSRWDVAFIVS
jgi:hypothetical protein